MQKEETVGLEMVFADIRDRKCSDMGTGYRERRQTVQRKVVVTDIGIGDKK